MTKMEKERKTIESGSDHQPAAQPREPAVPFDAPYDAVDLSESDNNINRLIRLAESGDERGFLDAAKSFECGEAGASRFHSAVRCALEAGAYLAARRIAALGADRFPDDHALERYARALAPPRVISRALPPDSSVAADQQWLTSHAGEYSGKWVAVKNGKLLGSADSLHELVEQVGNVDGVLLTAAR